MRSFLLPGVASVGLVLAGVAAAMPPGKISAGKLQRVEYTFFDAVGQKIGVKVYDCNGWVLKWGADSGAFQFVDFAPCP